MQNSGTILHKYGRGVVPAAADYSEGENTAPVLMGGQIEILSRWFF